MGNKEYKRINIKNIAILGLLTSLTILFTMAIKIPTPIGGYVNFGDVILLFAGLLMGGRKGAIVGGIGSALADLLGGHPHFAFITLIAKGGEGFLAGYTGKDINTNNKFIYIVSGLLLAGLWMVLCYFAGEWVMYGMAGAYSSVIPNILQAFCGIVGAIIIFQRLGKKLAKTTN
jgi:uncharacterized membrane protein